MINALSLPYVGTHELRKDLTKMLKNVKKTDEPVIITKDGKPAAILTSIENYKDLHEMIDELKIAIKELADRDYIKTLLTQKKQIKLGEGTTAKDLYKQLGI